MTRCIHCTRCVRFINEISGDFGLGVLGRGDSMEIGTYIEEFLGDELSANIIDLCPVGALTSMPYAFTARSWELNNINSIDILDSLASSVRIDVVNNKVMRILPNLDEDVNEDWITNKARFAYDSLNIQRLSYPKFRMCDKLVTISWGCALTLFAAFLIYKDVNCFNCYCGSFIDLQTTLTLKGFLNTLGTSNLNFQDNFNTYFDFRFSYLLNTTLNLLEIGTIFFLLGVNLRLESPILNQS